MKYNYSPQPGELIYHSVDYANIDVVQGLLRFYEIFYNQAKATMNTEVIAICLDLQNAINGISITVKQRQALALYMHGWTENQIGNIMGGISHQAVHKLLIKVCKKTSVFLAKATTKF